MPPELHAGPLTGATLSGRYTLGPIVHREITRATYAATDATTGAALWIEVLAATRARSREAVSVLESELARGTSIRHANVSLPIASGMSEDGLLFVVSDAFAGAPLARHLSALGPMAPPNAVDLAGQILGALEAAHAAELLHLNLSPYRVVLTSAPGSPPRVKVVGFGVAQTLARLVREGHVDWLCRPVWGAPRYFSPEMYADAGWDVASDLWATACVVYEALTGAPPFDAEAGDSLAEQILLGWPTPPSFVEPSVPVELDVVFFQALHKNPAARFPTAAMFKKALLGAWAKHRVAGMGQLEAIARGDTTSPSSPSSPHHGGLTAGPRTRGRLPIPDLAPLSSPEELTPTSHRFRHLGLAASR